MVYRTAPFSITLKDTYPGFKVTPFFDAKYLKKYRHNFNGMDLHMGYSTVSFRMILSYLEWLTKIFNDMKRCAVSLRQLSFLLNLVPSNGTLWCILACHYKLKRHSISRFRTRFAEKYITIRRNSPSQQPVSSITFPYGTAVVSVKCRISKRL